MHDETTFWDLLFPPLSALGAGGPLSVSAAIIWAAGIFFLLVVLYLAWCTARTLRRTRSLEAILADVTPEDVHGRRQELLERSEATTSTWFDRSKDGQTPAEHLWKEFDKTLVLSVDGKRLSSTVEAEHVFHSEQVAPELLHNRFLAAAPSILTAIGVLGTFIGLALGLSGLDVLGAGVIETDELAAGIGNLIASAGAAFVTSIWGVSLSVVANVAEKALDRWAVGRITRFQKQVDALFMHQTPEDSLVRIADSSHESTESLKILHEKIGDQLQQAISGLAGDMQEAVTGALKESIAPAMTDIAERAATQSSEVFDQLVGKFTDAFRDIGEQLAERLDAASAGVADALDDLRTGLDEQARTHREQLADLQSVTARQVELLEKSLPDIVSGLEEAAGQIGSSSESLGTAATRLQETADVFSTTSERFSDILAGSTEALEEITASHAGATTTVARLADQLTTLADSARTTGTALTEAATSLGADLEASRLHHEMLLSNLREQVEGVGETLSGWMTEYAHQVEKQTADRMDAWNEHTRDYTDHMLRATQGLSAAVDELEERTHPARSGAPSRPEATRADAA